MNCQLKIKLIYNKHKFTCFRRAHMLFSAKTWNVYCDGFNWIEFENRTIFYYLNKIFWPNAVYYTCSILCWKVSARAAIFAYNAFRKVVFFIIIIYKFAVLLLLFLLLWYYIHNQYTHNYCEFNRIVHTNTIKKHICIEFLPVLFLFFVLYITYIVFLYIVNGVEYSRRFHCMLNGEYTRQFIYLCAMHEYCVVFIYTSTIRTHKRIYLYD